MARLTNEQKIENFISENLDALKEYISEDDIQEIREWVNYKVQDYKENWKELEIENRCTIDNILDNISMDMG